MPPQLAELIPAEPPRVTAFGVDSRDEHPRGVTAALLVWGRHQPSSRWAAGICFTFGKFRGTAINALLTMWVPAEQVHPRHGESYRSVPRVQLHGPADDWPELPGRYPRIGEGWLPLHLHARRPDAAGEYRELRAAMRAFRR